MPGEGNVPSFRGSGCARRMQRFQLHSLIVPRAIWNGSISFGLVNIPVRLFTAVRRKTVRFNQIDSSTGARVKQKLVSDADGEEVPKERIVKGYPLARRRICDGV